MGWLDFLLGPAGKDQFADLVIAELRRQQALVGPADAPGQDNQAELQYDAERFCVTREDGGFMNLANVYHEYCRAPRGKRPRSAPRPSAPG